MRKLILQEFVSLDGYAANSEGKTTFFEHLTGEKAREIDKDLLHFIGTIDTILLGANTYRLFVDFWPTVTTDEELVADALNSTPKIVFSKTLTDAPWGKWEKATVVSGDAVEAVKKLKQQDGKDMVLWGSISLAQSLLKAGAVDEIQVRVCPVALGKGMPLFSEATHLNLVNSKVYQAGVTLLCFKPS